MFDQRDWQSPPRTEPGPDLSDADLREAKGRADRCERAYHRAMNAARLIAEMVPEAMTEQAWNYVAAAESREADEAARAKIAEVEGLRAEVERLNGVIDRVRDTLGRRDGIEPEAQRAVARAEAAEAEVERLTRERDEALAAADATIDVTPGEGLASVVRRVCEESDRTQIELDRATLSASKAHGARKEAEAEVERLRAALDEELSTDCEFTGEPNHSNCACCFKPDGSECGDPCDHHKAWRDERDRLRAAALPEDAEEIVFKELSIGVVEPQDLEIQEAIHAKRRAKARAVVKALRRQP